MEQDKTEQDKKEQDKGKGHRGMKNSIAVRVGLAIGAVLMAGTAMAQGPGAGGPGPMGGPGRGMDGHRPPFERAFGGHGNEGRWWNNPRIVERLKLTDDQRKQFDQILLQHRETLVDLHANLEKAEIALEPLMRDDQPNESAILAQIDKVAQGRAELEKANARYLLALRSKLTPEQWKQVQEFRENRGQMRGNWGPGGRGPNGHGPGGPGGRGPDGRGRDGRGPGNGPNAAPAGPGSQGTGPQGTQGMLDDDGGLGIPAEVGAPGGAGAAQ
jgi:periplasmic protein CpxP/Spy